jgi:hypothetical protein
MFMTRSLAARLTTVIALLILVQLSLYARSSAPEMIPMSVHRGASLLLPFLLARDGRASLTNWFAAAA